MHDKSPREQPATGHTAEFGQPFTAGHRLKAFSPAEEQAAARVEGHLEYLDAHPEIPPSPEEASQGLILRDIIEPSEPKFN